MSGVELGDGEVVFKVLPNTDDAKVPPLVCTGELVRLRFDERLSTGFSITNLTREVDGRFLATRSGVTGVLVGVRGSRLARGAGTIASVSLA